MCTGCRKTVGMQMKVVNDWMLLLGMSHISCTVLTCFSETSWHNLEKKPIPAEVTSSTALPHKFQFSVCCHIFIVFDRSFWQKHHWHECQVNLEFLMVSFSCSFSKGGMTVEHASLMTFKNHKLNEEIWIYVRYSVIHTRWEIYI